jgi:hypothetical protein
MKTAIFLGPTAPRPDLVDTEIFPPVTRGDIYTLLNSRIDRPDRIAIIDGFFRQHASVSHKEILFALEEGVEVFGAASMGALRAAELYTYGMKGIGKVYEWYVSGLVQADDEVALLHGPEINGYPRLTIACVELRATCYRLVDIGELTSSEARQVIDAANGICFEDRFLDVICDCIPTKRAGLHALLQKNWIYQKTIDATQLFAVLSRDAPCLAARKERAPTSWERSHRLHAKNRFGIQGTICLAVARLYFAEYSHCLERLVQEKIGAPCKHAEWYHFRTSWGGNYSDDALNELLDSDVGESVISLASLVVAKTSEILVANRLEHIPCISREAICCHFENTRSLRVAGTPLFSDRFAKLGYNNVEDIIGDIRSVYLFERLTDCGRGLAQQSLRIFSKL